MSDEIRLTEWYLVRHAPVKSSRKGIYKDADAVAELPEQDVVNALAAALPSTADWYVSPLSRTQTTARALLKVIGGTSSKITSSVEIKEQNFGKWQGLAFEQIWEEIEGLDAHNWSLLAASTIPPAGESFEQVYDRVGAFMKEAALRNPGTPKVIVTHAGIIRAFVGTALGLSANKALAFDAKPFSLTRLLQQTGKGKGGQWQLQCLNQRYEQT